VCLSRGLSRSMLQHGAAQTAPAKYAHPLQTYAARLRTSAAPPRNDSTSRRPTARELNGDMARRGHPGVSRDDNDAPLVAGWLHLRKAAWMSSTMSTSASNAADSRRAGENCAGYDDLRTRPCGVGGERPKAAWLPRWL